MPPLQPTGKRVEGPPKNLMKRQKGLEGLQGSVARGWTWPSAKIPSAAADKKAWTGTQLRTSNARRVVGRCPNWTNKGLLNAPSQDASVAPNGVEIGGVERKILAPKVGSCKVPTKGGVRRREKGFFLCVCVVVVVGIITCTTVQARLFLATVGYVEPP